MKSNKKAQTNQSNQTVIVISVALMLVWLVGLTSFAIWSWNIHLWQAKVDSEAIYQLTIENGKQQAIIEELQSK